MRESKRREEKSENKNEYKLNTNFNNFYKYKLTFMIGKKI